MKQESYYQDYIVQNGTIEGFPTYITISAYEQREAAKHGLYLSDLVSEAKRNNKDWQSDC